MSRTSVCHVKSKAYDVYIGRAMPGFAASAFANPFKVGRDGTRHECIERYRAYLLGRPDLMAQLESLRGKRLACWCSPRACHGDVLVELLEGRSDAHPPTQDWPTLVRQDSFF